MTPAELRPAELGLMLSAGSLGFERTIELARRADRADVGALACGDGIVDNAALMGALCAITHRCDLFTAITGWTRTPVCAALAASTLQSLSGGRYRLGLGTMPRAWSEQWHDVSAGRPLGRMRDYVAAIRQAWCSRADQPVAYEGEYYRFAGYAHPAASAMSPPPVSLAASRPAMARLAGEIADGVVFNLISSPEWIADALLPAVLEGRRERPGGEGESFELATVVYCVVDESVERAIARVRPALGFYFGVPYFADVLRHHGLERELAAGQAASERGDRDAMTAAVSAEMVNALALVGSPGEIAQRLDAYSRTVDRVLLSPPILLPADLTLQLSKRIIELTQVLVVA